MMLNVRRTFSDDRHHHIPSSPSVVSLDSIVEEPESPPTALKYF